MSDIERIKNFVASASPDMLLFDPLANNPPFDGSEPPLPPNATYQIKSVSWVVPAGEALNINVEFTAIKAQSVFISMEDDSRYIQLYKGETNGVMSRLTSSYYADPLTHNQKYFLTTASKVTAGREADQSWVNNHPLGPPRVDGFNKKTVWSTDDSRFPGQLANVKVTWYHPNYNLTIETTE